MSEKQSEISGKFSTYRIPAGIMKLQFQIYRRIQARKLSKEEVKSAQLVSTSTRPK